MCDWSSDVCSSDLQLWRRRRIGRMVMTIDPGDHQRVTAAVREAETRTSGEIVTISARSSDHYLDMVLAWGVLAVFLALATLAALPPRMVERLDRKSTRLNSSHSCATRLPSSA